MTLRASVLVDSIVIEMEREICLWTFSRQTPPSPPPPKTLYFLLTYLPYLLMPNNPVNKPGDVLIHSIYHSDWVRSNPTDFQLGERPQIPRQKVLAPTAQPCVERARSPIDDPKNPRSNFPKRGVEDLLAVRQDQRR